MYANITVDRDSGVQLNLNNPETTKKTSKYR